MSQNVSISNVSDNPNHGTVSDGEDFLKTEYTLLNQWAIHGEDVAHHIFNFYITLLTAVLGALLLVAQLISINVQTFLVIAGATCIFLLLLGIIFYDALVSQYIHNGYYHAGMRSIREYFRQHHKVTAGMLQLPSFLSTSNSKEANTLTRQLTAVKIGLPAGNQLSLIAGINSTLLGVCSPGNKFPGY